MPAVMPAVMVAYPSRHGPNTDPTRLEISSVKFWVARACRMLGVKHQVSAVVFAVVVAVVSAVMVSSVCRGVCRDALEWLP